MTWAAIWTLIGGWRGAVLLALSAVLGGALAVQTWRLDGAQADLAEEQGAHQAFRDKMVTLTAKASAAAAQARVEFYEAQQRAESAYQAGRDSAKQHQATVVADLRSGNIRLRNEWQACMSRPATGQAPAGASQGPDGPAEVPAEAFGRVLRVGADADNQVTWLQAELMATRQLAESCGKTE